MMKLGALYSFGMAAGLTVDGTDESTMVRATNTGTRGTRLQASIDAHGDIQLENTKRPTTYGADVTRMVVGSTGKVPDETELLLESDDAKTVGNSEIQFKTGYEDQAPMSPPTDFLEIHAAGITTNLLALDTNVMRGALETLSKAVYSSGQRTALKHLTDAVVLLERQTPVPDGGTAALAKRHKTMVDVVQPAINVMRGGLEDDYRTAWTDLESLLGVVNTTFRLVLPWQKAKIKTCAQDWCTAWTVKEDAVVQCNGSTYNFTNFDPPIASNDAFYKHIGAITDCPAGTALVNSKCPVVDFNLDQVLRDGFQNARNAYHSLDTIKNTKCGAKETAVIDEQTNKTAYVVKIKAFLDEHVDACGGPVYTSAATSFNTNNKHRVSMYDSLDKILCHLIKDTTASASCLAEPSTGAGRFPNYSTTNVTCPTRAYYADDISKYEGLSLVETWVPSNTTCPAVVAAGAAPSPVASTTVAPTIAATTTATTTLPPAPTSAGSATCEPVSGYTPCYCYANDGSHYPPSVPEIRAACGSATDIAIGGKKCDGTAVFFNVGPIHGTFADYLTEGQPNARYVTDFDTAGQFSWRDEADWIKLYQYNDNSKTNWIVCSDHTHQPSKDATWGNWGEVLSQDGSQSPVQDGTGSWQGDCVNDEYYIYIKA